MKVIKREIDSHDKPVLILPLSDLHIGDANCDTKLIQQCIDRVLETEGMYTILDGDLMNTAIVGSKSDSYSEQMTPAEQLQKCVEIFKPLAEKGKILAILTGNHEERIARSVGVNLTQVFAQQLGLLDKYSPTSTLLFLRFGRSIKKPDGRQQVYSIYINHGNGGGGKRAGSKINAMQDMANIITADVYLMGHTHQPASFRNAHYICNPTNMTATLKEQLFVNTASFLNWDNSYGDRAGFQPNSKEPPVIHLDDKRHYASVHL